jgi:hypothetical protein
MAAPMPREPPKTSAVLFRAGMEFIMVLSWWMPSPAVACAMLQRFH